MQDLGAADLHNSAVVNSVFVFVFFVVLDYSQLVAHEFCGPVTLLAGIACRAQIVQRRWNRTRIQIERNRNQLPGAVQLGLHEPVCTGPNVAVQRS